MYKVLAHARAEEIKFKELNSRSDNRGRELEAIVDQLELQLHSSQRETEVRAQQLRKVSHRANYHLHLKCSRAHMRPLWKLSTLPFEQLEDKLALAQSMLAVKDNTLRRRQDLLSTFDYTEEKPGRLSDDQRLAKEAMLREDVEEKDREISELQTKLGSSVSTELYTTTEAKMLKVNRALNSISPPKKKQMSLGVYLSPAMRKSFYKTHGLNKSWSGRCTKNAHVI